KLEESGSGGTPLVRALEEAKRPFLIEKEPLIRARLIRFEKRDFLLVITVHHMVADNYSRQILARELLITYSGLLKGTTPELSGLPIQYGDFSAWQQGLSVEQLDALLLYWRRKLHGRLQPLEIPTARHRALVHIFQAARLSFTLPGPLSAKIRKLGREEGTGNFILLLAAFKMLLQKYSGLEEIVIGTSARNRNRRGTENLIGPIANLLVLRSFFNETSTFSEVLRGQEETVEEAFRHGVIPFDRLASELNPAKDMSRTALFDVLFQYEDTPAPLPGVEKLEIEMIETNLGWGKYDLNMLIQDNGNYFSGQLVYNTEYYDAPDMSRLLGHYEELLRNIIEEPGQQVAQLHMLTGDEKRHLQEEWNRTRTGYPEDRTIGNLFEMQEEKTPHRVAVVFEDKALTYRQLNNRANRVAELLREKGIKSGEITGLLVERSLELIIGILGIVKSGAAYLPLDPRFPCERLIYMLTDSAAGILLTTEETAGMVPFGNTTVNLEDNAIYDGETGNPNPVNEPQDLLYVIYTSGTTGKPKGVLVEHRNLVRLFFNRRSLFDFNSNDVWTMFHSHSFDFSVWEMYGALLYGGRVNVVPKNVAVDTAAYLRLLKERGVTVLNQTPSAFYRLSDVELKHEKNELHLRYVIFGGEALSPAKLSQWAETYPRTKLINMFGITETTVHVTYKEITREEIRRNTANIGRPIPTLSTYVMDRNLRAQPMGVPGELCVGGAGVARGYLNKIELTVEKFPENPYRKGEKLYRSGDVGRYCENGDVLYMGRSDDQVQLRGFRIELREIENRLLLQDNIAEAVVIDRKDETGDTYLCAYLVTEKELDSFRLKTTLSETLPDYMIPSFFLRINHIPLTPNGKTDRGKLPEPQVTGTGDGYTAPTNETERKMAALWAEVLAVDSLGIEDNFFELGGHSLKASTLITRLHKEFDVEIPLQEVFIRPTIKELSQYLEESRENTFIPIEAVEKKEYYPVSPAQKRLFIMHRLDTAGLAYNMPLVFGIEGKFEKERVQKTFQAFIRRHESVRTTFEILNGEPVQKIWDHPGVFELENYRCYSAGESSDKIIRDFIRPFDLKQAPLLRVALIERTEEEHLMVMDMHHIISDGTSMSLMSKEFCRLYMGEQLSPLTVQYKDYSQWLHQRGINGEIKKQEQYWL
ncbi:MAG: amino acid adenylation domain-containing protein, partial [bacterium]|nr:amino acid adenylation domain-containing protein [bacterium]